MQKMQSSFKITILLYIIVLILPFSFYFVYTSFKTMQKDTKTVQLVSWTGGAIEHLAIDPSEKNSKQLIIKTDKTLQDISNWVKQNDTSEYYIGSTTLSEDFSKVKSCWSAYKQNLLQGNKDTIIQHSLQCYDLTENLAIIIEKMVYLKQNKMINMFYLSLALAMILLLLVIYLVRTYIYMQMKKHAIHDYETNLFNQKYFMAQLKISCARAVRYKHPLSMLSISIDDFGKGSDTYDTKTKEEILKMIGGLITSLTRTSDIACRYDEDHFSILLPDTEKENASILEGRVRETLEKHDFHISQNLKFKFSTIEFDNEESEEAFVTRAKNDLH